MTLRYQNDSPFTPADAAAAKAKGVAWESKAIFNVVEYGADPSGVQDSSLAIQAAINAAQAANISPATVYLPAGKYILSARTISDPNGPGCLLISKSGITLVGDGDATELHIPSWEFNIVVTTPLFNAGYDAYIQVGNPSNTFAIIENVVIRDLKITGTNNYGDAPTTTWMATITFGSVNNTTLGLGTTHNCGVDNVTFFGLGGSCVEFNGGAQSTLDPDSAWSEGGFVRNCHMINLKEEAMNAVSGGWRNLQINNNYIQDCVMALEWGSGGTNVTNNHFVRCTQGLVFVGPDAPRVPIWRWSLVDGNVFDQCGLDSTGKFQSVITFGETSDIVNKVRICNNVFRDSYGPVIWDNGGAQDIIVDNNIIDGIGYKSALVQKLPAPSFTFGDFVAINIGNGPAKVTNNHIKIDPTSPRLHYAKYGIAFHQGGVEQFMEGNTTVGPFQVRPFHMVDGIGAITGGTTPAYPRIDTNVDMTTGIRAAHLDPISQTPATVGFNGNGGSITIPVGGITSFQLFLNSDTTITDLTGGSIGQVVTIITANTAQLTIAQNTHLKLRAQKFVSNPYRQANAFSSITFVFDGSVWHELSRSDDLGGTYGEGFIPVAYGPSINVDAAVSSTIDIIITDGNAFTINNPVSSLFSQRISISMWNQTAGDSGAVSFGGQYVLTGQPISAIPSGLIQIIDFVKDPFNNKWREVSRSQFKFLSVTGLGATPGLTASGGAGNAQGILTTGGAGGGGNAHGIEAHAGVAAGYAGYFLGATSHAVVGSGGTNGYGGYFVGGASVNNAGVYGQGGVAGASGGVFQGAAGGHGVSGTGQGAGFGGDFVGGATGGGVRGTGGATSGHGVTGISVATNYAGLYGQGGSGGNAYGVVGYGSPDAPGGFFLAGASNGHGIISTAQGVNFSGVRAFGGPGGNGRGVWATGGAGGPGGYFEAGAGAGDANGAEGYGIGNGRGLFGQGAGNGAGVWGNGGPGGDGVQGNAGTGSNRYGGNFTGDGGAAGVLGQGGATSGIGVVGIGGSNASGGQFQGADASLGAVRGFCTAGNGIGGRFEGFGAGSGVYGFGGATGAGGKFDGNANRGNVNLNPLTATPAAPVDGDLWVENVGGTWHLKVRMNGVTSTIV